MKPQIKFGPAGLGPVKTAEKVLEQLYEQGIKACEIAFTYGVYIKNEEDARRIGNKAKELGISLSVHAPYFVNLNSAEKEKIEKSKQRILKCCETGTLLGASHVVFHPGYYGKSTKEQTYEVIKEQIKDMQKTIQAKGYTTKLAPETMGKVNVFGSIEEISSLVKDTGCSFCVDFAHILAREGKTDIEKLKKSFPQKHWHCHFSGIVYGEKGERHHKITPEENWYELLKEIKEKLSDKTLTIINESPAPAEDAIKGLEAYKSLEG